MSPLNEYQLTQFKWQLDQQQAQVRSTINAIFHASSHVNHRLEVKNLALLSIDQLIEFTLKIEIPALTSNIKKLKKIDASLVSIELGMYGLCSDCESEIIHSLLAHDPTTQRCSDCDAKYQKQHYNNYRL